MASLFNFNKDKEKEEEYFPYKIDHTPFVQDVKTAKTSLVKILERLDRLENKVEKHDDLLQHLEWLIKNWKTVAGGIIAVISISVYVVERLPDIKLSDRQEEPQEKVVEPPHTVNLQSGSPNSKPLSREQIKILERIIEQENLR